MHKNGSIWSLASRSLQEEVKNGFSISWKLYFSWSPSVFLSSEIHISEEDTALRKLYSVQKHETTIYDTI